MAETLFPTGPEDTRRLNRVLRAIIDGDDRDVEQILYELRQDPRGPDASAHLVVWMGQLLAAQWLRDMDRETLVESLDARIATLLAEAQGQLDPQGREG